MGEHGLISELYSSIKNELHINNLIIKFEKKN